jgi:hypothetical protein
MPYTADNIIHVPVVQVVRITAEEETELEIGSAGIGVRHQYGLLLGSYAAGNINAVYHVPGSSARPGGYTNRISPCVVIEVV